MKLVTGESSYKFTCLFSAIVFAAAFAWSVSAAKAQTYVGDLFELDGNTVNEPVGGPADGLDDWAAVVGGPGGITDGDPLVPGGSAAVTSFIDDPNGDTGMDDIFIGGGSKDDLPINGWRWTLGAPPDKDDLLDVGAAAYVPGSELLLYDFGSLYSANGDSSIGTWYFKKNIGPCADGTFGVVDNSSPTRACLAEQPAGPLHTLGDVLIISENSNGGTNTNISVYVWVGNQTSECAGTYSGTLVPPKNNLCLIGSFAGSTCDAGMDQTACGIMNQDSTESPDDWNYMSKFPPLAGTASPPGTDGIGSDDFPAFTFVESGINITSLFEGVGCFSSFLKNTRTSASVRSQLKDFASGGFGLCGLSVSKTCPSSRATIDGTQGGFCSETDVACTVATEGADCVGSGTDVCVVTNPQFLFGDTVRTQFTVTIGKNGPANLDNVKLKEKTLNTCSVIAIDGASITPIALTQNVYADIPGTLTGSKVLTLECDSSSSVTLNQVEVTAQANGNTVGPESTTMNDSSCAPAPTPGLNIAKVCNGDVKLIDDSGTLKFRVPVKITISNTGDEDLTNIVVSDDKIGTIPGGPFSLNKGASSTVFDSTYDTIVVEDAATYPDGWTGCNVFFKDIAGIDGATGAFSGPLGSGQLPADVSATCPFCPDSCNRN